MIDFSCIPAALEEYYTAIARETNKMILAFTGLNNAIIECCPNKRVVHLALHARKSRTRGKNFNRAIKILEREAVRK